MRIINIAGGLGNQMFQYAFACYLKHKYPEEQIYVDVHHYRSLFFRKFLGINLHNGFEIDKIFPAADLSIASKQEVRKLAHWIPNYVLSRLSRKLLPKRKTEYVADYNLNYSFDYQGVNFSGDCYYEGYWQCIKYYLPIKEQLLKLYKHPEANSYNGKLINLISKKASVGIHVRRGDYLNEPEFRGICDVEYYRKAITDLKKYVSWPVFFIFSNDIEWCKANLDPLLNPHEIIYVTENYGSNSCWDMFLMTYCKNLIIANSSFSWWGAFLNRDIHRVYVPYPWINRECEIDIYDEKWIKIK